MRELKNTHTTLVVLDLIKNAVISNTNSVTLPGRQFLRAGWTRFLSERGDGFPNTRKNCFRKLQDRFDSPILDFNLIFLFFLDHRSV